MTPTNTPAPGRALRSLTPSDPEFPQLWNLSRQRWPQIPQILQLPRYFQRSLTELWTIPMLLHPQEITGRVEALVRIARALAARDVLVAGPVFLAAPLALELELVQIRVWHPLGRPALPGRRGFHLLGVIPALPLTEIDR